MYQDNGNYDSGRVDIYIRQLNKSITKNFSFKQIKLFGYKARSRFGTAISKLEDVNDDGFKVGLCKKSSRTEKNQKMVNKIDFYSKK